MLRHTPADAAALNGDSASLFDAGAAVSLDSGPMRAWKEQLKLVARSPDLLNVSAQNPAVGAHVESLLVGLLCSHDTGHGTSAPSGISPLFVRLAEEFMAANLAAPMQLQDVARAAGVHRQNANQGVLADSQRQPDQPDAADAARLRASGHSGKHP